MGVLLDFCRQQNSRWRANVRCLKLCFYRLDRAEPPGFAYHRLLTLSSGSLCGLELVSSLRLCLDVHCPVAHLWGRQYPISWRYVNLGELFAQDWKFSLPRGMEEKNYLQLNILIFFEV